MVVVVMVVMMVVTTAVSCERGGHQPDSRLLLLLLQMKMMVSTANTITSSILSTSVYPSKGGRKEGKINDLEMKSDTADLLVIIVIVAATPHS